MCNSVIHEDGVRCPSDTSEARRLRRHNMKLKTRYGPEVHPPQPVSLPAVASEPEIVEPVEEELPADEKVLQNLHADNEALREALMSTNPDMELVDSITNRLGAGVETLSEIKYGAPTEEEISDSTARHQRLNLEIVTMHEREVEELRMSLEKMREEHLNNYPESKGTFPARTTRFWEQIAEENPVTASAGLELVNIKNVTEMDLYKARLKANSNENDPAIELIKKRNLALQQALQEAGVVFASPETIKVSDDSAPKAIKALQEALTFVPQAWVDNSNEAQKGGTQLRIKNTKGRAHYSNAKYQKKRVTRSVVYTKIVSDEWEPNEENKMKGKWVKLEPNEEWADPLDPSYSYTATPGVNRVAWIHQPYETRRTKPTTKVKDWEEYEEPELRFEKTENSIFGEMVPTGATTTKWRKLRTRSRLSLDSIKAELTVSDSRKGIIDHKNLGTRVALHEFSHRVENTTPHIKKLEDAFLQRRIGTFNPSVATEKKTSLDGMRGEYAYKDNFIHHYMGKPYSDGAREILSMGMETLWSGEQGAFSGLNGHKADPDMKRSILGMMLATGKPRNN